MLPLHLQMRWQGQDEEGHPLLVVHIGRLCNECQSHELAQQAADALISQVQALCWPCGTSSHQKKPAFPMPLHEEQAQRLLWAHILHERSTSGRLCSAAASRHTSPYVVKCHDASSTVKLLLLEQTSVAIGPSV